MNLLNFESYGIESKAFETILQRSLNETAYICLSEYKLKLIR